MHVPCLRQPEPRVTLDLSEVLSNWDVVSPEHPARLVRGRDGLEFLQLRIDAGLMQMHVNGRPDGTRYHGMPLALAHIEHELRLAGEGVTGGDWQELIRELNQLNYRRLAFSAVSETCLARQAPRQAERMLTGAIRDIDACLTCIRLIEERPGEQLTVDDESLPPTLVFNRSRHLTQLRVVQERYEDAVEAARAGVERLVESLSQREPAGDLDADPGVVHLRELIARLRAEYGINRTLREKLEAAVASEDFPRAAALRNELRKRPAVEGEFKLTLLI